MGKKLYVGNLGYGVKSSDLEQLFSAHGKVSSAEVITDRATGQSKGFGFVEMSSDQEAQAAIAALNGKAMAGRSRSMRRAPRKPAADAARVASAEAGASVAAGAAGAAAVLAAADAGK